MREERIWRRPQIVPMPLQTGEISEPQICLNGTGWKLCSEPGEEFWNSNRMKSKAAMGWYYIGVKDALQEDFAGIPAYEEYKMLVEKIFGSTSDWQRREQNEEDKDHMFCE